jgi:transposase
VGTHLEYAGACGRCSLLGLRQELIQARNEAASYRSQHARALEREAVLKAEVVSLEEKLRYERSMRFGSSGGKGSGRNEQQDRVQKKKPRRRGQQPGNPVPNRRSKQQLPVQDEEVKFPDELKLCPNCGMPQKLLPWTATSEVVEIQVRSYVRRIHRHQRSCTCGCGALAGIEVAPREKPGALFAGSQLGVSVWVEILYGRYIEMEPVRRVAMRLESTGLPLPLGTVHGSLPRMLELFQPLADLIAERNRASDHWHADETGHRVFVQVPDKQSNRWYLWVFVAEDTTVYRMEPSRSHEVVVDHLGSKAAGILSVDRAAIYKAFVGKAKRVVLAYCWAHLRRDFIKAQLEHPACATWSDAYIQDIGNLYYLNSQRCSGKRGAETALRRAAQEFRDKVAQDLASGLNPRPGQQQALATVIRHWDGLTVFLDHPEIPMDNNTAERALRMEVVGRKAFNGCGSLDMARLLAVMATVFNTLKQHRVDLRAWLFAFLSSCAFAGGHAPANVAEFLPWITPQPGQPQRGQAKAGTPSTQPRQRSRSPPRGHAA